MIISSQNRKSEYTKKKLSAAFFSLLEQESFASITVLQICQHAQISRAAFYRNFEAKEDILEYEVGEKIRQYIESSTMDLEELLFDEFSFFSVWGKEKELFRLLDENNLTDIFTKQLRRFFIQYLHGLYGDQDPVTDYLASTLAFGTVAVLSTWVSRDCRETEEELRTIFSQLRKLLIANL